MRLLEALVELLVVELSDGGGTAGGGTAVTEKIESFCIVSVVGLHGLKTNGGPGEFKYLYGLSTDDGPGVFKYLLGLICVFLSFLHL